MVQLYNDNVTEVLRQYNQDSVVTVATAQSNVSATGVQQIVAGNGIAVDPVTGQGIVTIEAVIDINYSNANVAAYLASNANVNIITQGNITGNYVIGNGALLTGLPASYSNANVAAYLASNANVMIVTTGNITGNYIIGNGALLTGLPASYSNANVANYLEVLTSNVTTTANVQAAYFIGNGSQLTGLPAGYSNADVAAYLASNANVTIITTGNITTSATVNTSNVVGAANSNTTVITNGYPWTFDQTGNLNLPGNTFALKYANGNQVSLSGTYNDANVAAFLPTYTGNLQGGNLLVVNSAVIQGNLTVLGNTTTINANTLNISDKDITVANGAVTLAEANGAGLIVGQGNLANIIFNNPANAWSLYPGVTTPGNVSGTYIIGNGAFLTNIPGANITGGYSNANVANYLPVYGGNILFGNLINTSNGTITTEANSTSYSLLQTNGLLIKNGTLSGSLSSANANGLVSMQPGAFTMTQYSLTYGATESAVLTPFQLQLTNRNPNVVPTLTFISNSANQGANVRIARTGLTHTEQGLRIEEFVSGSIYKLANVTANYFLGNGSRLTNLAAGSDFQVQYNKGGNLTADNTFYYDDANAGALYVNYTGGGSVWTDDMFIGNSLLVVNQANLGELGVGNIYVTNDIFANVITATFDIFTNNLTAIEDVGANNFTGGNIAVNETISGNNVTITSNVSAAYYLGNGYYLSGIQASNIVGAYGNSNVSNFLATGFGSNTITTTGNIQAGTVKGTNFQATSSAGGTLKNSSGITQASWGAGGGDNFSVAVSTNLDGANAQIDISPTGTGHVHIKPTGTGAVEIAPVNTGSINNMVIGNVTPAAATVTTLNATGNVTAVYFLGDGSLLANLPAGNYSNANVAAYLPTYTGNIGAGNITVTSNIVANVITATFDVNANNFVASEEVIANNFTGGNITVNETVIANNIVAGEDVSSNTAFVNSLLTIGGQLNGADADFGGNVLVGANIDVTGNATAAYYFGNGSQLTGITTTATESFNPFLLAGM